MLSAQSRFLTEHMRIFGLERSAIANRVVVMTEDDLSQTQLPVASGPSEILVLERPGEALAASLGLRRSLRPGTEGICRQPGSDVPILRTLGNPLVYEGTDWQPVLHTADGSATWVVGNHAGFRVIIIGTTLVSDLTIYRQGDASLANRGGSGNLWGQSNERPNHLYERTAPPSGLLERQADHWAELLTVTVANAAGVLRQPILPGGAPGALVITGDDDQAEVERYAMQIAALHDLPVTYFLHPKTRLTRRNMKELFRSHGRIDLGIHPDALDAPGDYDSLFDEQCRWFRGLVGSPPRSVRNHGYLNDGYWGHLGAWLAHDVTVSSNLPGVDGRVVSQSLIPMRVIKDGILTPHWSILTLFGDGMVSALGMSDEESAVRFLGVCEEIAASGLPGVVVVNVHPQNFPENVALHRALRAAVDNGFVAWTISEMHEWFKTGTFNRTRRNRISASIRARFG